MATACADAERLCFEQPRMAKIVARPTGAWLLAEKISMYDATPPTRASAVGRTMKLDHVAIWAENIELLRAFDEKYFGARSNPKYENERKRFTSYFNTLATHTSGWSSALEPRSTRLRDDCRETGSRCSMDQDGRATDTTRAWLLTLRATESLSPNSPC